MWKDFLETGVVFTLKKGQVLLYEDHIPSGLFVLLKGDLTFSGGEKQCRGHHLTETPKGMLVFLQQLLSKQAVCCRCVAKTKCLLMYISPVNLSPFINLNKKELP